MGSTSLVSACFSASFLTDGSVFVNVFHAQLMLDRFIGFIEILVNV